MALAFRAIDSHFFWAAPILYLDGKVAKMSSILNRYPADNSMQKCKKHSFSPKDGLTAKMTSNSEQQEQVMDGSKSAISEPMGRELEIEESLEVQSTRISG